MYWMSPKKCLLFVCLFVILCVLQYKVHDVGVFKTSSFTQEVYTEQLRKVHDFKDNHVRSKTSSATDSRVLRVKIADRDLLYADRRAVVQQGCRALNKPLRNMFESKWYDIEKKHNILYCSIPKVASTFWRRVFAVIGKTAPPGKAVFDLKLSSVKLSRLSTLSKSEKKRLQMNGTSLLFVRDPYTRIFSAYENKLYQGNTYYWNDIGRPAVAIIRNSTDERYKKFGYDLTFSELVKYILYLHDKGKYIDVHFSPMHKVCDPCIHQFDYIGNFETFMDDYEYLLDMWKHKYPDIDFHIDDMASESVVEYVRYSVGSLYGTASKLDGTHLPFKNLMLRHWRDIQIRGYMSKFIPFPYREANNIDDISQEDFKSSVEKGLKATVNRTAAKLQRDEALVQAYRTVSMEDLERLREYVKPDCQLFGYDDRPKRLFDRSTPLNTDILYLDGI